MNSLKRPRPERPSKKRAAARTAWVALLLAIPGCVGPAEPGSILPTLAVPTAAAARMSHDTAVTLYYSPRDCFTCFGVLGHWVAVANTTAVTVRLSLDSHPDEKTLQAIRRMRLPFELGVTSPEDEHSGRPRGTMKELLTVRGHAVDSAVVPRKVVTSPLLNRMNAIK